jgi:hypothetical protein
LEKRASGQGSRYSWSFDPAYEIYEADTRGNILRRLTSASGSRVASLVRNGSVA